MKEVFQTIAQSRLSSVEEKSFKTYALQFTSIHNELPTYVVRLQFCHWWVQKGDQVLVDAETIVETSELSVLHGLKVKKLISRMYFSDEWPCFDFHSMFEFDDGCRLYITPHRSWLDEELDIECTVELFSLQLPRVTYDFLENASILIYPTVDPQLGKEK
jgi:hypothetical protein